MARGFFGRRRDGGSVDGPPDWPRLPVAAEPAPSPALDGPALAYVQAIASAVPAETLEPIEGTTPEAALLSHIAACRSAVADALYQSSRDYQVLCDLVHESLPACEQAITELRRRLNGNVHYAVLAKLDEAYALAEASMAGESR
ncbi:MAG TPA: hypothetical protein VIV01_18970 [Hyphomicrobiaceae bacterium]|jgi:hypothetical protein